MAQSYKDYMKNTHFRVLAAVLLLSPFALWTVPLKASIDPSPSLHFSNLEIPQDVFATPRSLRDNVAFWRKVFAEWRMNQVVLHDTDYPELVYEVIDLQGKTAESFTADQIEQIKQRREALEERLSHIAAAQHNGASLSDKDRALREHIIAVAGKPALSDAADRVRVQRGLRERFQRGLEMSGRYDRIFRQAFREEGIPEDLAYLPHVESSFQNRARSSAGAAGMWQFTRSAGRLFMTVNRAVDQRMDPVAAARGAARYLHQAYDMLGNWAMAVTSYNHGIKGMLRAKAQYGNDFNSIVENYDSRTFGFASRNFYAEFLAVRDIAHHRDRYFSEDLDMKHPLALDSVVLDRPMHSRTLSRYYGVKYSKLVALNPAWTRRTVRGITRIPAGIEVWLPAGTLSHADGDSDNASSGGLMQVSFPPKSASFSRAESLPAPVSVFHIVHRNESLSTIAFHYGLSVATLRALNDIPAQKNRIYVGQKLRVRDAVEPVVGGKDGNAVIHVVRRGDSLSVIAVSYGVPMRELLDANQLTRRSTLYPGQRLEIPVDH